MPSEQNFWGNLINDDKSPSPRLEKLCLAIAELMVSSHGKSLAIPTDLLVQQTFDAKDNTYITPDRIAAFYKKVGGNYDSVFLQTTPQALSFIYQSLGCFHSLEPKLEDSSDAYKPPSIPSLLPTGFVRWQTIQLLMDPDEHCTYLQNAVRLWDLTYSDGQEPPNTDLFPKEIPRDAFPLTPDKQMLAWHEGVSQRLEHDYMKRHTKRASPSNFGTYHNNYGSKDRLSDEEDFVPRDPRRTSKRNSHVEHNRHSAHHHHHRDHSGEHPPSSGHRGSVNRTGFSSPRFASPPPAPSPDPDHSFRRGVRANGYGHPISPGTGNTLQVSDASSDEHHVAEQGSRTPRRRRRRRHLSPPSDGHSRRHSHEAYTRRPRREYSPGPLDPHTEHVEGHSSNSSASYPETSEKGSDRSRTKTAGVKFRDFIFGTPAAPDPPPPPQAPPRRPHHRAHAAEGVRQGNYFVGNPGSPSAGGSEFERPRAYSNAGIPRAQARPAQKVSASRRPKPSSMPDDGYAYGPMPLYES